MLRGPLPPCVRMQITAALTYAPDAPFELQEVELDDPRDDEILVRMVAVEAGTSVSAVDPRGLPAAGAAPKLIAALRAKLGG